MVSYDITVLNQGQIAADNIELIDYIPACMSLADAGWTLSGSDAIRTLSVANGDLPATGLAPGSSVDVTIVLMLSASADLSCDLTNWSEITFSTDTDGDVIADNDLSLIHI